MERLRGYGRLRAGVFGGGSGGGGDPYFSSVVSLNHFEGANLATTTTDQIAGTTWTLHTGNISTTEFVAGASSLYVPDASSGSAATVGGAVSSTASPGLTLAGEFTIEGFVSAQESGGSGITVYYLSNSDFLQNSGLAITGSSQGISTSYTFPKNAWTHFAVTRDASNTVRLFFGGVLYGSTTSTSSLNYDGLSLGAPFASTGTHNCYYDEFRITNGACRYTANFAPPAVPFPNS